MSAAVAAILEGMPEPRDLRMHQHDGRCVITAGSRVLFDYAAGDVVMRLFASAMLAADPVASGVYYVDDHFVPYTGRSRPRRAGTTSGAGPGGAARTPMSPRTTGGRCAS
ncbi:MAG TPA: hypothetical protein VMV92_13455 [Streptosporangiaceae bacterium]|nr:hypothetical protein [Streptosporangiaceae bacterium]